MGSAVPLVTPPDLRPLVEKAVDRSHMTEVLNRRLAELAGVPVRVLQCEPTVIKSRKSLKQGRLRFLYRLQIEAAGRRGEQTLLGTVPAGPRDLEALQPLSEAAREHPALAPFRRLAALVDELRMVIHFFPLDPALPGLVEVTRPNSRALAACFEGLQGGSLRWELKHYKPFNRCVLRVTGRVQGRPEPRAVFVKLFADDRGEASYRDLARLSEVAGRCRHLRVPQALAYDRDLRMLVMSEAPGERTLTAWIKRLEDGEPLPEGVDAARVRRCLDVVAGALAELHATDLPLTARRTFAGELAVLGKDLGVMRAAAPDFADQFEGLLADLEAHAPSDEPMVPSHGGFRHKQMVGDETNLTVIDWDGLTLANPALDAATFLRRLLQEPLRHPQRGAAMLPLAEHCRQAFLDREPAMSPRHLDLYLAVSLVEYALRAFRRPKKRDQVLPELQRLLDAARRRL